MQYTTNYNLMKPEPSDMYSVEHQNQNSDILDEVLVPEFEDYEVTDDETETQSETTEIEIPDAATALASIKSKTKIAQLFSNIKAFCKGCCTLGMLVNNCVTDNASLPLAASQGKMLMDQINLLNSKQEINITYLYGNPSMPLYKLGRYVFFTSEVWLNPYAGTIPNEFRPSSQVWFSAYEGTLKKQLLGLLQTDGAFKIYYPEFPTILENASIVCSFGWFIN